MTDNEHPITPPPELVQRLRSEAPHGIRDAGVTRELQLITAAYRAGADQELEACRFWLAENESLSLSEALMDARRPKPPSLKERALNLLPDCPGGIAMRLTLHNDDVIFLRRVIEQLPD